MEKQYQGLLEQARKLSEIAEFEKEVNNRSFELEITKMASSFKMNAELEKVLEEEIEKNRDDNKKYAFVLYFVLFTMCRRQNYGNILDLSKQYNETFNEYEIIRHINLMAVLVKSTDASTIYKAIKNGTNLVSMKNENCDFTVNTGVLNAYCELICKYFEFQLDERKEPENVEYLKKGLSCIIQAIKIETLEKGSVDKVYSKFFLNRGRLLILLGKHSKGEADIVKAIELLPLSADRESKVTEYNQYLVKASIIHAYDLNEEKVQDLDKIKVSNYKSIALMTTLLGFLLGTINIFTTISDTYTLGMLMLCYLGLLLILVGTILLGFTLNFKERKGRLYVYDSLLILVGAIIFIVTIILINK